MSWRITRIKLFEMGHSFEYIDSLNMVDIGDIIGYWSGKSKAEEKQRKQAQAKSKKGAGRRGRRR